MVDKNRGRWRKQTNWKSITKDLFPDQTWQQASVFIPWTFYKMMVILEESKSEVTGRIGNQEGGTFS